MTKLQPVLSHQPRHASPPYHPALPAHLARHARPPLRLVRERECRADMGEQDQVLTLSAGGGQFF